LDGLCVLLDQDDLLPMIEEDTLLRMTPMDKEVHSNTTAEVSSSTIFFPEKESRDFGAVVGSLDEQVSLIVATDLSSQSQDDPHDVRMVIIIFQHIELDSWIYSVARDEMEGEEGEEGGTEGEREGGAHLSCRRL
jgi:bifunctional N-acetylglucosamine-1-phosphate-uridyltransferase/glucosamine-1-phosphate-acetyltransferase GlmU-like protein